MTGTVTEEELAAGRGYETLFVPALFKPWTTHVADAAAIAPGDHLLDVACGSGVLAREVLARTGATGRVVGLDPAPGMLAAAAEVEPGIEWVLGTAEDPGFADESFDAVVSQFGMMFFADREKAAREMFRLTRPGGRLAVAVWNSIGHNPAYGDITAVLDETVGTAAGDAVRLPFCLGDADGVVKTFAEAGFTRVEVATRTEVARFPSAKTMVEVELRGWLPLFGITLDEAKIAEVLAIAGSRLAGYAEASGAAVFPASAHIVTARRP